MHRAGADNSKLPAALGVTGTLAVIMPAFLTGALAVQIRDGLDLREADLGLAIGAFFVGSAGGSIVLGRLAERLGPQTAIRLGLCLTAATNLAVAAFADGPRMLQGILVAAGLANALVQPAINLMLVRVVPSGRLGFVMALKQSGMPGAALLGGIAVPAVALTIGWRAAYVFAAGLALIAGVLSWFVGQQSARNGTDRYHKPSDPGSGTTSNGRAVPDLGNGMLGLMAAVGVLGGGAANILVGYLVSGAVAAGVAPGPAGLLLTLGASMGVASRLIHGWLADRMSIEPLARVILLFWIGSAGALGLAVQSGMTYLLASPVVFAAGWAWPGLFNLVVVSANRSAPAAATGVTQTGVYLGSLASPVIAGLLIERSGYRAAWLLTGAALLGAGLLASVVRTRLHETGVNDQRSLTSNGIQPAQEPR